MNAHTDRAGNAIRQAKIFVVPALLIGGWLALFASVATAMSNPFPLQVSIEKVLSTKSPAAPAADAVAQR